MKKQLKTLLMSMACIFAAQTVSAQDFYIGGTAGVGVLEGDFRAHNSATLERTRSHAGNTSFIGGGIVGVEYTFCNNIYTAIEARALYDSFSNNIRRTVNSAGGIYEIHVKNDFIYGGDFKLGYTLDCCVTPYLLIGVEAGQIKTRIRNTGSTPVNGLGAFDTTSYKKNRCAPKAGLGVRFPICDVFAADMQYSYTWYEQQKHHLTDPVTANLWHNKTRVDQHKFMVSLNYSFSFLSCL